MVWQVAGRHVWHGAGGRQVAGVQSSLINRDSASMLLEEKAGKRAKDQSRHQKNHSPVGWFTLQASPARRNDPLLQYYLIIPVFFPSFSILSAGGLVACCRSTYRDDEYRELGSIN